MTCKNTHAGPFRELHVRVTSGPQLRGRGHALPIVPAPPPAPPRLGGPSPPTRSRRQATAGHLYLTLILREGTLRRVCLPRRRSREAQRGALDAHGVVATADAAPACESRVRARFSASAPRGRSASPRGGLCAAVQDTARPCPKRPHRRVLSSSESEARSPPPSALASWPVRRVSVVPQVCGAGPRLPFAFSR